MKYKVVLVLGMILFGLSFVSPQDPTIYQNCEIYGNCLPEEPPFDNNTAFVNDSEFCGGVLCTEKANLDGSNQPWTGDLNLSDNALFVGTGTSRIQASSGFPERMVLHGGGTSLTFKDYGEIFFDQAGTTQFEFFRTGIQILDILNAASGGFVNVQIQNNLSVGEGGTVSETNQIEINDGRAIMRYNGVVNSFDIIGGAGKFVRLFADGDSSEDLYMTLDPAFAGRGIRIHQNVSFENNNLTNIDDLVADTINTSHLLGNGGATNDVLFFESDGVGVDNAPHIQNTGISWIFKNPSSSLTFARLNLVESGLVQLTSFIGASETSLTLDGDGNTFKGNVNIEDNLTIDTNLTVRGSTILANLSVQNISNATNIQVTNSLDFIGTVEMPGVYVDEVMSNLQVYDGETTGTFLYVNPFIEDTSIYNYDVGQFVTFAPGLEFANTFNNTSPLSDTGFFAVTVRTRPKFKISHNGEDTSIEAAGLFVIPEFSRTGSFLGNTTYQRFASVRSEPNVLIGTTITNLTHFRIVGNTNTGNATLERGLHIEDINTGDEIIGIHSQLSSGSGNKKFIDHIGNAPSTFKGNIFFQADNIGTFFGASDDVKTFLNVSGHFDEVQMGSVPRIFKDYVNISFESDIFITGSVNATTYHRSNGGNTTSNSSCTIISSPDGTTTINICNDSF